MRYLKFKSLFILAVKHDSKKTALFGEVTR